MKHLSTSIFVPDEKQMLALGATLAALCAHAEVIYFLGDLGAGKTTLCRGFLRGLGLTGIVKSPSYTLVEPYEIQGRSIFHFDFYRINDTQELEFIGIKDYFGAGAICLVEWPERGGEQLPTADLSCYIENRLEGRQVRIEAYSLQGKTIVEQLIKLHGNQHS